MYLRKKRKKANHMQSIQGTVMICPPMVVAPCGDRRTLRAGIGMTINLPSHLISVTQHYFNQE